MNGVEVVVSSYRNVQRALREDVADIDDDLYWWQPGPEQNHIGFLFWHIVRDEDTVVSHVSGEPEVWAGEGWHERLGMDVTEQGTGLEPSRIATFRYDRPAFMEYASRTWARTLASLPKLQDRDLDRQAWPGSDWTLATQLVEGSIGHAWVHLGEMRAIRGLRGWRFRE